MKKSWLKKYAQDGKKVAALSPEDAAIAKVLMERNRGKNFVDRAFDAGYIQQGEYTDKEGKDLLPIAPVPNSVVARYPLIPLEGEGYMSHFMAEDWGEAATAYGKPTYKVNPKTGRKVQTNAMFAGPYRVYPTVVQNKSGNIVQLDDNQAYNYADETGEYINAPTQHIASMLANKGYKKATGIPTYKQGGMIKRADGSYSQRGLWDNIRANTGSGKKPTKEMLKQEKKIRAKEKAQSGIYMPVANASTPFMPNSNRTVVQQAPSFLNGVPEGFDMNTKFGYMQYLQDSIADESRKRIVDKGYNQKDPTITLNKGNFRNAKVNTKVIDDAIASAKKKGIPLWQMMGIAGQESTLGTNRKESDSGYERPNTQRNIVSGWNTTEPVLPEDFEVYMAGHGVPGVKAIKTKKRYIGTTVDRDAAEKYLQEHPKVIDSYRKSQSLKIPKKPMSEFDYAASYLKEKGVKGYNPEDADYRNKVNARIKELSSDPAFMDYVKQKGYNLGTVQQYKNGGWLAKYEDGGDTSEGFSPSELATLREAQANYKPAPYQDMDPAMLQQYRLMEKIATPQGRGEVIIQKAKENRKKLIEEQGIKSKEAAQYLKDKAAQQRAQEDPSMFTPSFWTEDPVTGRRPEDRLYDMGTDLQTRVFQTGNETYDSYLNAPGFTAHMAGNLAKAPLKAKQENSVMPYVSAIAEPLAVGTAEAVVAPYLKKILSKKPVVYGESNVAPHDPYSSISMRPGGNGKFPMAVIKKTKGNTPMPFETEIDPSTVPDFNVGIELDSRGYPIDSKDPSKNILQREIRQLFSNINPENLNTSSGLDWMKQWYSDPEFIKRYSPTGRYRSTAMQEHIADQLNEYVPKNYTDLLKDEGLKTYIDKSLSTGGLSYGAPNQIYTNRAMYFPFNKKGLESVRAHELTHLIESNGVHLSPADEAALQKPFDLKKLSEKPNSLKKAFGNNPHYYMDPTEIHARMNQARFELGLSPKDKFTEEMFDKISKEKDWYGMGKYIKDKKGFTSLMNNFWSVAPYAVPATIAMSQKDNKKNGGKITNNWLQNY